MRTSLRSFLLLAAAVATPACENSAVEPQGTPNFAVAGAERIVEEEVYDLDGDTVMFFCVLDGEDIITEPIALRGRIVEQFTLLQLPSGGYHAGFQVKSHTVNANGELVVEREKMREECEL